jgi:lysophospholipase L1-like esterase
MPGFKVLSAGDSVVWGQGLLTRDKFHELAASDLGAVAFEPVVVHVAHSGAVIDTSESTGPVDQSVPYWQEKPHPTPTILDQLETFKREHGGPDAEVRLVILNGGINDIGFTSILAPGGLGGLERAIRKHCFHGMKRMLGTARTTCPNAVIVVVGYYPMISEMSELNVVRLYLGLVGLLGPGGMLVPAALARRAARRARYFHRRQLHWFRKAVTEFQADPHRRGPDVLFAHPAFGPRNSVGAPNPLLFEPRPPAGTDVDALWKGFLHYVVPGVGVIELDGDAMLHRRRHACVQLLPDPWQMPERAKCILASVGHPNRLGARRYADAIKTRYKANRQIRLRTPLSRMLGRTARLSLRRGLARFGLTGPGTSVRDAQQHFVVDSIQIAVKTRSAANAGTDDDVFLRISPGRQWRLNEGFLEGDFRNDFEAGRTDTYAIDPADGRPKKRLHLWEIQELSLVKRNAGLGIAGDWRPEWIQLELNGREVFRARVGRTLTDAAPVWKAPGYPGRV